jgi:tetratricopeptide (TPR) repeat protein
MGILDRLFGKKKDNSAVKYLMAFNENVAKNHHEDALSNIQKAIELDPHNPIFHYNKGTLLYQLKRDEEAIPYLEKAIKLKSGKLKFKEHVIEFELRNAHFNLAMSNFYVKNNEEALKHAKISEKLNFDLSEVERLYKMIELMTLQENLKNQLYTTGSE